MEDTTKYLVGGLVAGTFIGVGLMSLAIYLKVQQVLDYTNTLQNLREQ